MSHNEKLELMVSLVLIGGVVLSLGVLVLALAGYSLRFGQEIIMDDEYRVAAENFFAYVFSLQRYSFTATGLLAAGVVILMLTPYVRVLTSLVYFASEKDLKYVLITAFVLAVLTVSLLTH
jgi:uncharacterized membrane protein